MDAFRKRHGQAAKPTKRLLILRHAKSSWTDIHRPDFDRPLNARGRIACERLGIFLNETAIAPDMVLCSPARRTCETLECIQAITKWHTSVRFKTALYAAELETLLGHIHDVPPHVSDLMLVGHNPGVQELALYFVGSGPGHLHKQLTRKFPTGALAEIGFDQSNWASLERGTGHLYAFTMPRKLR